MSPEHNQGLGVSIVIYMIALVCGLALFVVPVLLLNGPQQYANRGMAAYEPPPGTFVIPKPARYSSSLAVFNQDDTVDAAFAAALNAKVKKAEKPRLLAIRTEQRVRTMPPSADMRYAQPANSGRSIFSLF